jgi:ATP-binding cassette subfamily F protein 3
MIFVSHDRDFINDLATHILELTPTGAFFYHGNFDSYLYQKQHNGEMPEPNPSTGFPLRQGFAGQAGCTKPPVEEKISTSTKSNKELYLLRKESNRLERMVSKAEEKIAELTKKSTESTWGSAESAAIQQELEALKEKHAALTAEWEKIELQCNE